MPVEQCPVEPGTLVVVAVQVVVAGLGAPDLVAHQDHGHAYREQSDGEEVLHLLVSELFHRRIFGRAFDAAVPAPVVVRAVAVALAVVLVVLSVVGDEVVRREAVVAGDEVDALLRLAPLVAIQLGAADHPVGEAPHHAVRAAQEAPDVVTKAAVPLPPAVSDEAAYLIEARCVPRLGDDLDAG